MVSVTSLSFPILGAHDRSRHAHVLMYHELYDPRKTIPLHSRSYEVSVEDFQRHVRALQADTRSSPLTDLGAIPISDGGALTMDDGSESSLQAADIAKWRKRHWGGPTTLSVRSC